MTEQTSQPEKEKNALKQDAENLKNEETNTGDQENKVVENATEDNSEPKKNEEAGLKTSEEKAAESPASEQGKDHEQKSGETGEESDSVAKLESSGEEEKQEAREEKAKEEDKETDTDPDKDSEKETEAVISPESKETPPADESKETVPDADTKETPPADESKETVPDADTKDTPPADESKETVPDADTKETPPADESKETVPNADTKETPPADETKKDAGQEEEGDGEDDEELEEDPDSQKNFDEMSRQGLVEALEETVKEADVSKIKTKIALIKVAFLNKTKSEQQDRLEKSIEEDTDEKTEEKDKLQERFDLAFSIYRQNKSQYNKELEKSKQENLEKKKQILEDLKELINSEETLKKTYDQFKELQDKWKEIGMVPRSEVNNLWQSYHFLVEKFFDKVKINKELRDLDLKKNMEAKIELCEKAEELLLETSIIKSFKELQKLHEKFKEIGPIPQDKKDEVWDRFKAATDKINERRREHYARLSENQENNLEAKTALCKKAEDLLGRENKGMKNWQENTRQMNELFKVWKTIGPAPKKHNDEIWDRFKSSLNAFFENRREFFNQVKEQQLNNYNLKLDLCAQAEAAKDNTDWKKTTDELINLQKEWKKIGPVPRKYSDKIWKRFRAANDHFFNKKAEYFSNIHEHEAKNLDDKKKLIEELGNYDFGDDKKENLQMIKEFQRRWMDIGHVPIKQKDSIQNEFRKAIDDQLEKLKISSLEISTMAYKNKVENLKDDPNARKAIGRERNFLIGKINKMKEDINLWENNVGFLANSKKADVLKKEFTKKIEKAKEDVKVFEAKLKYLNSQS